jgi:hypothetical protein
LLCGKNSRLAQNYSPMTVWVDSHEKWIIKTRIALFIQATTAWQDFIWQRS